MFEVKCKVNNGFVRDKICYAVIKDNEKGTLFRYWDEEEDCWLFCCDVRLYTGLKDKNGNEIYEGDVAKTNYGNLIVKFGEHAYNSEKEFVDGVYLPCYGFYLESTCVSYCYNISSLSDDLEVIGNIYKNPELLKGE